MKVCTDACILGAWFAQKTPAYSQVLDIGSGTGRAPLYLRSRQPGLAVVGVEPSAELRAIGYAAGIAADALVDGDATRLAYADASFDIVCEFGVLHHVEDPRRVVSEMLRVARIGIFISDDNHFAAGSPLNRFAKRALDSLGLWKTAYRVRSGGKGYRISAGDGLSYPYSVFDDLAFVRSRCDLVQTANMDGCGPDLYADAAHVALFGRKRGGPWTQR